MMNKTMIKSFPELTAIEHAEPDKKVLCGYCNLPIHVSEFGGINKERGMFHLRCYEEAGRKVRKETVVL